MISESAERDLTVMIMTRILHSLCIAFNLYDSFDHSKSILASMSSTAYSASPSMSRALFPVTSISPPKSYCSSSMSSSCTAMNSSELVPMAAKRYFSAYFWRNVVALARLCSLTLATKGFLFFYASRKVASAAYCFSCCDALYSRVFLLSLIHI